MTRDEKIKQALEQNIRNRDLGSRLQGRAANAEESRQQQPNRELMPLLEKTLFPDRVPSTFEGQLIKRRPRDERDR